MDEERILIDEQLQQVDELRSISGEVGDDSGVGAPDIIEVPAIQSMSQSEQEQEIQARRAGEAEMLVGDDSGVDPPVLDYVPMIDGELTEDHKTRDPEWRANLAWLDRLITEGVDLEVLSAQTLLPLDQLEIRKTNLTNGG